MLLKMDLRVNRQFAEINGLAAWTGFSLSVSFVTIDFRIVSSVVVCILDASKVFNKVSATRQWLVCYFV